jgi:hypothetical protein
MDSFASRPARGGTVGRGNRAQALRAGLLLAFGLVEGALVLLAFRIPHLTTWVLLLVMAAFLLLDGIAAALEAARARGGGAWLLVRAVASIVAAVVTVSLGSPLSLKVFAVWALVTGALDIPRSSGATRVAAALALALGVWILVDVRDPARLLLAIAAYGIVAGLLILRGAVHPAPVDSAGPVS